MQSLFPHRSNVGAKHTQHGLGRDFGNNTDPRLNTQGISGSSALLLTIEDDQHLPLSCSGYSLAHPARSERVVHFKQYTWSNSACCSVVRSPPSFTITGLLMTSSSASIAKPLQLSWSKLQTACTSLEAIHQAATSKEAMQTILQSATSKLKPSGFGGDFELCLHCQAT